MPDQSLTAAATANPYAPPRSDSPQDSQLSSPATVESVAESYSRGSMVMRRWAGCWIDLILSFAFLLIPDAVLGNDLYQKTMEIWLLLVAGYFIIPEVLWGRTPGKLISGTVVVNQYGYPPSLIQVLVRTVFRIVEVNPACMGGVPAGIVVWNSRRRQRLGDMVAGTFVIRSADVRRVRDVAPQQGAHPPADYTSENLH